MDVRLDKLPMDPAALQAIVRAQAAELKSRDTLIDRLKAQLAALKRARFGKSSEKLDRQSNSWNWHWKTARPTYPRQRRKVLPCRRRRPPTGRRVGLRRPICRARKVCSK